MTAFLQRIRTFIEAHPGRAVVLCSILALPLTGVLAGMQAVQWRRQHMAQAMELAREELRTRTESVAEKTAYAFETMHNLTDLLAGDATLADALRAPGGLRAADLRLQAIADTLRLHRVLLMNRQGVCVASNEETPAANLIGVDLADRDYVARALKGERLSQFVVGRVSSVPGFHFAAPVVRNGRVLGVLALKMELRALAGPLSLSSVIIADAMGVVVLSENPDRLLMAVPDAPALALDPEQCRLRYKRDALQMLSMRKVKVYGQLAYLVNGESAPSLRQVVRMPNENLTVYGFHSLKGDLAEADSRFLQHVVTYFSVIYLAGFLLLATVVYVLRDWRQRDQLRELNLELAAQAQHDPLTGCYNRRPFDDMLEREARRSVRTGQPFALAYVDLDRFKAVNDTHGHAVGDAVLVHVADTMRAGLREVDIIARLGGDEFAVLLPGVDEQTAAVILRRVVEGFQNAAIETGEGPLGRTVGQTVSVGVAAFRPGMAPAELILEADRALYVSKKLGRNQVAVHQAEESSGGG